MSGGAPRDALPVIGVLAVTGFFLHFAWEMWQVPFFREMAAAPHQKVVWLCTRAAFGDVAIATGALIAPRFLGHGPAALVWLRPAAVVAWVMGGLLVTVVFEIHATRVADRWQYARSMPVLPLIGVGLLPVVQWLLVPTAILFFTRYFCIGWWQRRGPPGAGNAEPNNESGDF